jgi:hypothetical protein
MYISYKILYIENKCDYHQNSVLNKSSPAEQTLVGMIVSIFYFKKNLPFWFV